jgi:GR25 family glycosyltransferase involved in LPS biosynthesis
MRIFIINLPRDTERRAFMERQLAGARVPYEFVEGTDREDVRIDRECDDALAIRERGAVLNRGEKGCALSHRSIYERMVAEHIPCALILEDDAVLAPAFLEVALTLARHQPLDWDWLQFGYPEPGVGFMKARAGAVLGAGRRRALRKLAQVPGFCAAQLAESFRAWRARSNPSTAGVKVPHRALPHSSAYLITLRGVEKIMPLLRPIRVPADVVPARGVSEGLVYRIYVPCLVRQSHEFTSNTAE